MFVIFLYSSQKSGYFFLNNCCHAQLYKKKIIEKKTLLNVFLEVLNNKNKIMKITMIIDLSPALKAREVFNCTLLYNFRNHVKLVSLQKHKYTLKNTFSC